MFEIEIGTLLLSVIAIIISGFSLYFVHLEPPKLVIEYLTKRQTEFIFYEHIISIVNNGGKTAIIKELRTISDQEIEVKRHKILVTSEDKDWKLNEPEPFAVIPINPKKNIVIFYTVSEINMKPESNYWFEITIDKSVKEEHVKNKSPNMIKIKYS